MLMLAVKMRLGLGRAVERAMRIPDRGSETMDKVLWALGVIIIAGIVIAAVTTYVTNKSNQLNG